jgi:two-component system chemotaxis response regulator CheB
VANKIKVLVVDDSAFMRKVISEMLSSDSSLEVVGQARDGIDAARKMQDLRPDVITLDVEMPRMGGLETLGYIMSEQPTPVVMLSAHTQRGADLTLKALEYGAADFVQKPSGSISLDLEKVKEELIGKVKFRDPDAPLPQNIFPKAAEKAVGKTPGAARRPGSLLVAERVVVIASSTGGPRALAEVVPLLPADLPAAVLIVQHMSAGFTNTMAARLENAGRMKVREAVEGELIMAGQVYVAPGDWHMELAVSEQGPVVALNQRPPYLGVRPAADPLLLSVAKIYGRRSLGVILTGMGHDGTKGLKALKAAGATVLAQDEATCVVYGMPRHAMEAGVVDRSLPISAIAEAITELFPA